MLLLALLAVLMDHTVSVPAGHWLPIAVKVQHAGTTVDCSIDSDTRVDAFILTQADAKRFDNGRSVHPIGHTGFQKESRLRIAIDQPGDYFLMLDNRLEGRQAAKIAVKIDLWSTNGVEPITLAPRQRYLVVASSLLFFVAVVVYSARKLRLG